jgi:NitT/TauT family transport system permease protein
MITSFHKFLLADKVLYGVLGVIIFLVFWQALSWIFNAMIVASPLVTINALFALLTETKTWEYIMITLFRLIVGLFLGSIVGLLLGLAAGTNNKIRQVLEPIKWTSMTIPAIVISIMAMLWFGMGSEQVIFVVIIIVAPITYVNAMEGRFAIDEKLIEMGRCFNLPLKMFFREIYLPGIAASVIAGFALTAGMGVRVVVLAEFMGAHDGIGYGLSKSYMYLDTPELFAWILISLSLLGFLEFCIMKPLKTHMMRWKKGGNLS